MSDKPNADTTKKPTTAAAAAQQSPPIDTAAAQLVYDDLRRFCEARRSDIASTQRRARLHGSSRTVHPRRGRQHPSLNPSRPNPSPVRDHSPIS